MSEKEDFNKANFSLKLCVSRAALSDRICGWAHTDAIGA